MTDQEQNPDLIYARATTQQLTKHFQNNAQVWAAPLAQRDYLELQYQLSETEVNGKNAAYWVIYHRDDPETVISSCTTYVRDVIINTGQGSKRAKAAIVADVFTHPEYRMKGMAAMLLRGVQKTLDTKVEELIEFSVLYSNINTELYEGLGWKSYPATQLRLLLDKKEVKNHPVLFTPYVGDTSQAGFKDQLVLLNYKTLVGFMDRDVNMAKLRLSAMRDKKTHVQFTPTEMISKWHIVRSKLYRHRLVRDKKSPDIYGAIYLDDETQAGAWAWWAHDFRSRKLYIGRLAATRHTGMEARMKELLLAAATEANVWGLREVVIWDPTPQVVAGAETLSQSLEGAVKAVVEERTETVPCLRWRGGEDREVDWQDRQYYGWC